MTTIPIEAEVSTEQLLRAVARLPPQEIAAFVSELLALRAQRQEPHLSQAETALLLQINEGTPDVLLLNCDAVVNLRHLLYMHGEHSATMPAPD